MKPGKIKSDDEVPLSKMIKSSHHEDESSDNDDKGTDLYGNVVWAKVRSHPWWPGMIIKGSDCGKNPAKHNQVWIFWFGECQISEIYKSSQILDFKTNFKVKYAACQKAEFQKSVLEALEEITSRAKITLDDDLIAWANNNFPLKPGTTISLGQGPDVTTKTKEKLANLRTYMEEQDDPQNPEVASKTKKDWKKNSKILKKTYNEKRGNKYSLNDVNLETKVEVTNNNEKVTDNNEKKLKRKLTETNENKDTRNDADIVGETSAEKPKETDKTKQDSENLKSVVRKKKKNSSNDVDEKRIEDVLTSVINGVVPIQEICVSCIKPNVDVKIPHPVIEGGLCGKCENYLLETFYSIGDDGFYTNCTFCTLADVLVLCENEGCYRSFCHECVEMFISKEALAKVKLENPWHCYLCRKYKKEEFGIIKIKKNWKSNIKLLFEPKRKNESVIDYSKFLNNKKALNVLSLFDGIGTGRVVLDKMGIEVASYHAYEIDQDAINVSKMKLPSKIRYLGDVQNFKDNELLKIGPIDLLIGGSPCNDISMVNPNRKGLYDVEGTGHLFFYFFKVLKAIELENHKRKRPFFWLFENVSHMPTKIKEVISNFLECDPQLINACHFSAQHRARYFWGNIPGLYSALPQHILDRDITLEASLIPNLNRTATVKKLRTLTTSSNSLKQQHVGYPVKMNEKDDNIWITELEKVFGFDQHYTDTGNLQMSQRQRLLGRSWSVPVVEYLLKPLKDFYKMKK